MDYSQILLKVLNSRADVTYANECLNRTTQYLDEIDSTTENFTKDHESYEQKMAENQHNYEVKMDDMKKNFNSSNDKWRKETLRELNERFSKYKVHALSSAEYKTLFFCSNLIIR